MKKYQKGYISIEYLPLANKWGGLYAVVFNFLGKNKNREYIIDMRVPVYLCSDDLPKGKAKIKNGSIVGDLKR